MRKWGKMRRGLATLCSAALLCQTVPVLVRAQETMEAAVPPAVSSEKEWLRAVAQASGGEAFVLGEDITRREPHVKHFRLSDGTFLAAVYDETVHFASGGSYREVDNTLQAVQREGRPYWRNTESDVTVLLPSSLTAGAPIYVEYNGYTLGLSLQDAGGTGQVTQPAESRETQLQARLYQLTADSEEASRLMSRSSSAQLSSLAAVELDADIASLTAHEAARALMNEQLTVHKATAEVTYPAAMGTGAAGTVEVGYALKGRQLKESLTLSGVPSAGSFVYTIGATGLRAVLEEDRSVTFWAADEANGEPVFTLAAPFMWDAAGEHSYDIAVTLEETATGFVYTMAPSRAWLTAADRSYPVVIDPTIDAGSSYDTVNDTTGARDTLTDAKFNTLTNERAYLKAGKWNGVELVSLIYADLPSEITSSCRIVKATLRLDYYRSGLSSAATDLQLNAHRILSDWPRDNRVLKSTELPSIETAVLDAVVVNDSESTMHNQQVVIDITGAAQRWVTDARNYGILLEADQLTNWKYARFYDSDHGVQSHAPTFTYVYRDTKGLEDYWTYTSVAAGRFGSVLVNNYTGGLVAVQELDGVAGNRMPVSLQAVYNSAAATVLSRSRIGAGWQMNVDMRVQAVTSQALLERGYPYVLTDGDGTQHYFRTDEDGKIEDEDGLGYTLTKNSDNTYTIAVQGGGEMRFDTAGGLSAIADTNGNTLTMTQSAGMLSSVTDGAGRTYTLTRDGTTFLKELTAPDGAKTTFAYEAIDGGLLTGVNGRLTQITYPDGETTTFTYRPGTSLLTSVTDSVSGLRTDISYIEVAGETGPRLRVSSVSRGVSDTAAARAVTYGFTYAHNATDATMTTQDDTQTTAQTVSYRFNNWGHTIGVVDQTSGLAEYYAYGQTGGTKTGEENRLLSSSALQSSTVNYLADPSFEAGSAWTKTGSAGAMTYETAVKRTGNRSLKLTKTATDSLGIQQIVSKQNYTFSVYVSTNGTTLTGKGVRLRVYARNSAESTEASSAYITHTGAGEWQRLTVTLTDMPSTATSWVTLEFDEASTGTVYVDDAQLEDGEVANPYTLLENGAAGSTAAWSYYDGTAAASGTVSEGALQITGSAAAARHWEQTVKVSGAAGDVFRFGGWSKGASLETDYAYTGASVYKRGQAAYRIRVRFLNAAGGAVGEYVAAFNPGVQEWQFVSGQAVATGAYASAKIYLDYDYNVNTALFKNVYLSREAFGQSYTYDSHGNLVSTVDLAKTESSFMYSNDQLSALVNPTGSRYFYSNDETTRNLLFAHSSDGQVYAFTYDSYGNPTGSRTDPAKTASSLSAGKTYIIRNVGSGRVMAVSSIALNGWILQKNYQGNANERWQLTAKAGTNEWGIAIGNFELQISAPFCIIMAPQSSGFTITPAGDGTFRILSSSSCLQEEEFTGLRVVRFSTPDESSAYQKWLFTEYTAPGDGPYLETSATYTSDGNQLSSLTDAQGSTVSYQYALASGLLQSATDPKGTVTSYTYDTMRRVTGIQSGDVQNSYIYDDDRLTAILHSGGQVRYSFGYDALGRRTTTTVGNATQSRTLSANAYDDRGRLTTLTYGNGASVGYMYDSLDRLTQQNHGATPAFRYAYTADGKAGLLTDYVNNHRTRYIYDFAGRLTGLARTAGSASDDGATLLKLSYAYEDKTNRLTAADVTLPDATVHNAYTYGAPANGQRPDAVYRVTSTVTKGAATVTMGQGYFYDALGRLSGIQYGTSPSACGYHYAPGAGANQTTMQVQKITWAADDLEYTYDANGNIATVSRYGVLKEKYTYDSLNQLIRVDSAVANTTTTYTYDAGGNLLTRTVYPYTTGALGTALDTVSYGYADASWKDLLTSYDGEALSYDAIGNPLTWRDGMTFTWSNGRQLSHFAGGSEAAGTAVGADYTYGADGYRTKKVVTNPDGTVTTTTFHVEGTTLLGETRVTQAFAGGVPASLSRVELVYLYDHTGSMYGFVMTVMGGAAGTVTSAYCYQRNLQGDVIGLLDASGAMGSPTFSYTYDPWGNLLSVKDAGGNAVTDAASPALINPIRYRGYYHDDESGLYYLQSRYYDPEVGRFLNADGLIGGNTGASTYNMFSYCANNPVNMVDPTGTCAQCFASALPGPGLGKALLYGMYMNQAEEIHSLATATYYNQNTNKSIYYKNKTYAEAGCGPTAGAIVASTLKGEEISPNTIGKTFPLAQENYKGTFNYMMSLVATLNGLQYTTTKTLSDLKRNMTTNNRMAIAQMKKGDFTSGSHFVVIVDYNPSLNTFYILDPNRGNSSYTSNVIREPLGIPGGAIIDADVFHRQHMSKYYVYWN